MRSIQVFITAYRKRFEHEISDENTRHSLSILEENDSFEKNFRHSKFYL